MLALAFENMETGRIRTLGELRAGVRGDSMIWKRSMSWRSKGQEKGSGILKGHYSSIFKDLAGEETKAGNCIQVLHIVPGSVYLLTCVRVKSERFRNTYANCVLCISTVVCLKG